MQLIGLSIHDVLRVVAVELSPNGELFVVGGDNEQGKTSIIDAIQILLGGLSSKTHPEPVHRGADKGVIVKGNMLNVLEAANPATSNNPLYARQTANDGGVISGRILLSGFVPVNYNNAFAFVLQDPLNASSRYEKPSSAYTLQDSSHSTSVPLATDSLCYAGDNGGNYRLSVNGSDPFLFPIKKAPEPWQYDFVLSPIISTIGLKDISKSVPPALLDRSQRPNDIRIVVSWVGENAFASGFAKPVAGSPTIESLGFSQPPVTGFDYFTKPDTDLWKIWSHGRGQTPGLLSEESYTVNTADMQNDTYVFYVRTEDGSAIKNIGRTAKLRVDVYLPKTPARVPDYATFTRPDKSFQFSLADVSSDNPGASYWEVLKIQKTPSDVINRIENVTVPLDNGRIVTGVAQF